LSGIDEVIEDESLPRQVGTRDDESSVFDNALHGDVDFSEYPQKGLEFAPLPPSIAWPNGADVAPESLYEKFLQKEQNRECVVRQ